jgi:hypothetical protein
MAVFTPMHYLIMALPVLVILGLIYFFKKR